MLDILDVRALLMGYGVEGGGLMNEERKLRISPLLDDMDEATHDQDGTATPC